MIKLKDIIKEDCQCGNDCCSTKLNENTNIDLPQGMEMGKIFTGHGFAFKKEEFDEGTCGYGEEGELDDEPAGPHLIKKKTESTKGGSLPNKAKNVDKVKKVKAEPDSQKGTYDSTDTFNQHHAGSQGSGDMGNQAEPDTYDWDDSGTDANEPGHQKKKNPKKKGYEPVEVKESFASMFGEFTKHMKSSYEVQAAKDLTDEYDIGKVLYVFRTNRRAFDKAINDKMKEKKIFNKAKKLKESDLGLTLKKGKTIKVTHKKSGKELVIIDKPNVKREYEKIGYYAEGKVNELSPRVKKMSDKEMVQYILYVKKYKPSLFRIMKKDRDVQKLVKKFKVESIKENLYNVDQDMKDGKFDEKNPQVHIQGYGVLTLKTLGEALSRKFSDLAKRAKKGEIENVNSVLNKSGVLQAFVKAYMDAKKELKSGTMKRKITMYKRKR